MTIDRKAHWETVYQTRREDRHSWYEPQPEHSLELVRVALSQGARSLIDIGGGTSRLVDGVLSEGLDRVAVLDVSETALATTRDRLRTRADEIELILADVTMIDTVGTFDIWHDRAVFHFLISAEDRSRYRELVARTIPAGGYAIIATFGSKGPERCSGLPVHRYDEQELQDELGDGFTLARSFAVNHKTPAGAEQQFLYTMLERREGWDG